MSRGLKPTANGTDGAQSHCRIIFSTFRRTDAKRDPNSGTGQLTGVASSDILDSSQALDTVPYRMGDLGRHRRARQRPNPVDRAGKPEREWT